MNWFQRLYATPKAHAALGVISTVVAASVPPQYQAIASVFAGMFAANAAVLPHPADPTPAVAVPAPVPVAVPAPVPGSLHAQDWAALIAAAIQAAQKPADPAPPK